MFDYTRFVKAPKNKKDLPYIAKKYYNGVIFLVGLYNSLVKSLFSQESPASDYKDLNEIKRKARTETDISDHLETIFNESMAVNPKLIVELGIGPGESTFVFERVAKLCDSKLVSVDIRPEMGKASSWPDWIFVCEDDISFALKFKNWVQEKGISSQIDILFIDTSHKYEHTLQEIKQWFPFLSARAKVFFHDTNVQPVYRRRDGTIGLTYDIKRAVIRAIEDFFRTSFNEKHDFTKRLAGWTITHHHFCNGLTVLDKNNFQS